MKWPEPSRISGRALRVWQRNFSIYRQNWKISFVPPLLEPLLYILAFGVGLAVMVGDLDYGGQKLTYTRFIAPALVSVAIMYNAFFETTYNSFVRMYYQKTFDALLATPLNIEEVILGEMLWAATKSLIAATLMGMVISLCGLFEFPGAQSRALQARPCFVKQHMKALSLLMGRANHAQCRAVIDRGQRAGVAMVQHGITIVDEFRAERAHALIGSHIFVGNTLGFLQQQRS